MSETMQNSISETEGRPNPEDAMTTKRKPRRSHKLRTAVLVLVTLGFVGVLIAGWYGMVPGISSMLGATKARDLGVRYDAADLTSYGQKTAIKFADFATAPANPNRPGKKLIFGDPKSVENLVLTQSEITAAVNNLDWKSMPLSNVQVKFGDGNVEVSGNLNTTKVASFIKFIGGVGYSPANVDKAVGWAQRLLNDAPVYVNASVSATNDQLAFTLHEAKVGRVTIPQNIAANVLRSGLTNAISNADNYEIRSASFSNGQLNFSGTYPTTVYVAH